MFNLDAYCVSLCDSIHIPPKPVIIISKILWGGGGGVFLPFTSVH